MSEADVSVALTYQSADVDHRTEVLTRLRRIEGQTRGLQAMVSEGRDCPEVLQQIAAVEGALRQVALLLTRDHLENWIGESAEDGGRSTDQVMDALGGLVR